MKLFQTSALLLSIVLGGCANIAGTAGKPPTADVGIDGVPCVGSTTAPASGVVESTNPTLVSRAQLKSGAGGVCSAKVYAVTEPVVLYRVFDASKPYTQFGTWWSLKKPEGTKADYRVANAICPEWSPLDRVVTCEVRPGTQIVLGTTQSATCADGSILAKTADIQVMVPNDGRAGIVHTGACRDEAPWP